MPKPWFWQLGQETHLWPGWACQLPMREFNLIPWPQIFISQIHESLTLSHGLEEFRSVVQCWKSQIIISNNRQSLTLFYGLKSSFQKNATILPYFMASNLHFKNSWEFHSVFQCWTSKIILSKNRQSSTLFDGLISSFQKIHESLTLFVIISWPQIFISKIRESSGLFSGVESLKLPFQNIASLTWFYGLKSSFQKMRQFYLISWPQIFMSKTRESSIADMTSCWQASLHIPTYP